MIEYCYEKIWKEPKESCYKRVPESISELKLLRDILLEFVDL